MPVAAVVTACASSGPQTTEQTPKGMRNAQTSMSLPKPPLPPVEDVNPTVGPGDDLNILVYRHTDLTLGTVPVRTDGNITMPLIGDVKVEGLTIPQLRETLETRFARYIVNPQIVISYNKINSQKIFVLGEVTTPGIIKLDDRLTLLQAILKSGGMTHDARSSQVLLIRKSKAYALSVDSIFNGDPTQDVPIVNGDIVYVPSTTLSDLGRTFSHITKILSPIIQLESGIVLSPQVEDVIRGNAGGDGASLSIPAQ